MKELTQSSDKSTYLRAEKPNFGCGITSRISFLAGEFSPAMLKVVTTINF